MEKVGKIIEALEAINDVDKGFVSIIQFEEISKEEMDMLIALLDESEYIKGEKYTGNARGVIPQRSTKIDEYYLYFGNGKILRLSYEETEVDNRIEVYKESEVNAIIYVGPDETIVKFNDFNRKISIINQNDLEVFDSLTPEGCDYQKYDGQKVSDVLVPVTVEDLKRRFYGCLEEAKGEEYAK